MDEEVAGHARPIVAIVAPAEDPQRVVGPFGGRTQEALPVDGFLRGVGRDGVLPCPDGVVARPEALRVVELPDGALLVQLLRLLVAERAHPLAAHLENASRFLLGADQVVTFGDVVHHGLLAVDRLARPERFNRDGLMPVIRRAHYDRVDVVAGKDFPVVAGGEDVAVPLAGGVEAAVEDVARGHEFDAGDAQRRIHVGHAHAARADDRQADAVGGSDLAGAGIVPGRERVPPGHPVDGARLLRSQHGRQARSHHRSGRDGLHEVPAAAIESVRVSIVDRASIFLFRS